MPEVYAFLLMNGVGIGLIYFLLAVGMTIVFSLVGFVNFSHGAMYMIGAFLAYSCASVGIGFWPSLVIVPLSVAVLGVIVEKALLRHAYKLTHDIQILLTFGITIIINELTLMAWGPIAKNVPAPQELAGIIEIFSFYYPLYRVFVIAVVLAFTGLLWFSIERTRLGAVLRAGSESAEMVQLLGINVYRAFSLTFALAAFLAGLAGVLAAPLRGVDLAMGAEALGIAFVVSVIGGLGSFAGAFWGSVLVGVVQSFMSTFWPESAKVAIYLFMTLVLLVRPRGLFGRA